MATCANAHPYAPYAQRATIPQVSPPTNVSSVPQRSVFRYPGGKTWLIPQIRTWLATQSAPPKLLIEPFAGGGITSLTAVAENLVERALLIELDPNVAAVWQVLVYGDAEGLARKIEKFQFSETNVRTELGKSPRSDLGRAFQTILRNRVQRGGIMAKRAGLMKTGERARGLGSRWYPETLAKRIRDITTYRDRLDFITGDGLAVMSAHTSEKTTALFVDPPYSASTAGAGSRLYAASQLDHARLFQLAKAHQGPLLATYDNVPEVRALAAGYDLNVREISMKSTHNAEMKELLIGRNLSWAP